MGHSWSSRRRNNRHNNSHHHQNPSRPPPLPPPPSSNPPGTLNPYAPRPQPQPPSYAFAATAPYPANQPPNQNPYSLLHAPAPPPLPFHSHHSSSYNYARHMMGQSNYHAHYGNQGNGWPGYQPAAVPPHLLPPYVDHQSTKKIKNDVNVHKDTISIEVDENNPDYSLVSFTFDAMVDGSISIFYFGKEGATCSFTPLYPEIHMPVRISFQKRLGQRFRQPSGTGIDLGFFDRNDLLKPLALPGEQVFPLVISAESNLPSLAKDEELDQSIMGVVSHAQITQAVLEKNDDSHFHVKVIKQILWVDGVRYELREIFGISSSNEASNSINDTDSGKECVICMTELKDTAVLPCRHMCMCSGCAKELRLQSDKCPICRQPIQELMEIKVNEDHS